VLGIRPFGDVFGVSLMKVLVLGRLNAESRSGLRLTRLGLCLLELLILFCGTVLTTRSLALSKTISLYIRGGIMFPLKLLQNSKQRASRVNIIEYRSNEVALSKLLSGKSEYDIAIVSNWVLRVLEDANKVEAKTLESLIHKRKYLDFTTQFLENPVFHICGRRQPLLPTRKILKRGLKSIKALLALQSRSYTVGIVDDPIEFAARVVVG
jgi:hypothetical protein